MEEKYQNFIKYNWQSDDNWKMYLNNIYPPPDKTNINKIRKKYYKTKIDVDYDINYEPGNISSKLIENCNQGHNLNDCSSHQHQYNDKNISIENKKSISYSITSALEMFLFLFITFGLLIKDFQPRLGIVACAIHILKTKPKKLKLLEYLNIRILSNEYFHMMLFCSLLQLFQQDLNYFVTFPLTITSFYNICDYFSKNLQIFTFLKIHFDKISNNYYNFEILKCYSYIIIMMFLPLGIVLSFNSILFSLVFSLYLKFLSFYNSTFKKSVNIIINALKNKQAKASNRLIIFYYSLAIKYTNLFS